LTDAYNALLTYITPVITDPLVTFDSTSVVFDQLIFVDMVGVVNIDKAVFNAKFKAYYDAKIALIKAITDAGKTYVNSVKTVLETSITQTQQSITLKASQTDFDALGSRMYTAEASISVQAGQISQKVNAGDIISTINQTADTITIQAKKINLIGELTLNGILTQDGRIMADHLEVESIVAQKLAATEGTIAGFTINGTGLVNTTNVNANIRMSNNGQLFDVSTIDPDGNGSPETTTVTIGISTIRPGLTNRALFLDASGADVNIALEIFRGDIIIPLIRWSTYSGHKGSARPVYWDDVYKKLYWN
jgi:ribosome-associated translation inhibitor RaiA